MYCDFDKVRSPFTLKYDIIESYMKSEYTHGVLKIT